MYLKLLKVCRPARPGAANGERPTIAYSRDASPYTPRIAYRTGPGSWTVAPHPQSTSSNWWVVKTKRVHEDARIGA